VSTAGRWATSPLALVLIVLTVYAVVVVDSTDNDPSLAPFTALSLVRDGDTDLRDLPPEILVERPLVIVGQPAGVTFDSVEQVRAALDAAGPDAEVRDYFPVVPALLAVPTVVAVDLLGPPLGQGDAEQLLLEDRFGWLHTVTASVVVVLALLIARSITLGLVSGTEGRRRWIATVTTLVLAFGTTAWSVASRALWQHGPSLLLLLAALWLVLSLRGGGDTGARPGEHPGSATVDPEAAGRGDATGAPGWTAPALGVVLTAAVVTRPTNAVPALALLGWVAWSRRDRLGPVVLGVVVSAVVAAGLAAALGLGVPPPYYSASRITVGAETVGAFAANLVSPSRGLLVSTPVVLLALPGAWLWWRRPADRPLVVALVLWVGGLVLAVSAFTQWWAGHTFAARFTTESLPALLLLAVPALDAVAPQRNGTAAVAAVGPDRAPGWMRSRAALVVVVVLAVWSVGFHAAGAWSRQTSCWNEGPVDVDDEPARVWSVTDAQVGRAAGALVVHGPRRAVAGPC